MAGFEVITEVIALRLQASGGEESFWAIADMQRIELSRIVVNLIH
jgi:hypothetical protein